MKEIIHKSGFVSIIGKPNAGKSTLLNALMGRKLAITTPKASTTRHRILGIENGDDYQIVYSDTPGVIKPKYELHNRMMRFVKNAVEDADVIVLLIAVDEKFPEAELLKLASKSHIPKILAMNKMDLSTPKMVQRRMDEIGDKMEFVEQIALSATEDFNVGPLRDLVLRHLPEGPAYFDKDQMSDRPERFFVSEMIREKVFSFLKQELPYSSEVEIMEFKEGEKFTRISANIHVERKSQKGMIIGKGGTMIKRIGMAARKDIEAFLDEKVHLELFVKVSDGWKDNNRYLRGFGYE